MKLPSPRIWEEVAERLNCSEAAIRAVFDVEASGRFFNTNGTLVQRFEPHHFPRHHWGAIGFYPGNKAPWRASLAIRVEAIIAATLTRLKAIQN